MKLTDSLLSRTEKEVLKKVVGYKTTHISRYDGFIVFCDSKGNGSSIPIKDMFSFIKEDEIYEIKELLND